MDPRVVTKKNSVGGRIVGSVKSVFLGIAIVIISSVVLVLNESCSVKNTRAFEEVEKNYTAVANAQALSQNDGKLVAVEGGQISFVPVGDIDYGIISNSFHLRRSVEFYQRIETKRESSTGNETRYSYSNGWSNNRIDSQRFHDNSEKNANANLPQGDRYNSGSITASNASLGDFALTRSHIMQLSATVQITPENTTAEGFTVNGYYVINEDQNPASPKIGDVRISYYISNAETASAIAQQSGTGLVPYIAANGVGINRVFAGVRTGEQMIADMHSENNITTWGARIFFTIFICMGFSMLLAPVHVLVGLVPFLGNFLSNLTSTIAGFIGGVLGIALSLLIIAVSWIAVRPLVAIPLLLGVAVLIFVVLAIQRSNKNKKQLQTAGSVIA